MGVMLVHVFCGEWPFPADAFQPDPRNPDSLVPVTEVERRAEFLRKIGNDHLLTLLIRCCLSNNPTLRPDAAQIHVQLSEVKVNLPSMAETRIELVQQLQSSQDEVVALWKALDTMRKEKGEEVEALKREREEEVESLRKQLLDLSVRRSAESSVFETSVVSLCIY